MEDLGDARPQRRHDAGIRRAIATRPAGAVHRTRRGSRAAAVLLAWALTSLIALTPGASAAWRQVASNPTTSAPYYVCPREAGKVSCQSIRDPAPRIPRQGPLPAGAIGPTAAGETSPAFSGHGEDGGYSPADLRSAYSLPSSGGNGRTVAIVAAMDDPDAAADLGVFRSHYGIPPCGEAQECFRKVNETGGAVPPAPDKKWAEEISLDLDMTSVACPECKILLVEASSPEQSDMAVAEETAVRLGANAIDDSFLGPEAPEFASAYDHPGVAIAASSGDSGFGVQSPAAYPGVIAVGGTSLHTSSNRRGWSETAWSQSGSGCSTEPKPSWQTDSGCSQRTVSDVSASHWLLLGGTSVASPLVAATMAMATGYTRSFEGADALYLEVASSSGGFNDIVEGSNGVCGNYLCRAMTGYDGPTGLGSLHGVPELPVPLPVTGSATAITTSEATLQATVNTYGAPLDGCTFEYGTSSSSEHAVPCSSLPGPSIHAVPVTARATGLNAGRQYRFRLVLAYPTGPGAGADAVFQTLPGGPSAATLAASAPTGSTATLNGTVEPNGAALTACDFEYGTTVAYGSSAPCGSLPGGTSGSTAVSATLSGLRPGMVYHYRLVTANVNGAGDGADETVTTLPSAPLVTTRPASFITASSATLNGTVDPDGGKLSSCAFEFESAETLVPCEATPQASSGAVAVHAVVTGLSAGATYVFRLVAVNAGGASYAQLVQFTALTGDPLLTPPPSSPSAKSYALLTARRAAVGRHGVVVLTVRCPATTPHCAGRLLLRVPAGHGGAERTLASAAFHARTHGSATLALHLSARGLRAVGAKSLLRVVATVLTDQPSAPPAVWHGILALRRSGR